MTLEPGSSLGYEVVPAIGVTGMGEVCKAREIPLEASGRSTRIAEVFMQRALPVLLAIWTLTGSAALAQTLAEQLVEQMRGFSMQSPATVPSDGRVDRIEQRRRRIADGLRRLGQASVPALVVGLADSDVQMRRNAALMFIELARGLTAPDARTVDTRAGMPALIQATEDEDAQVRAWAAHALAEIGPDAAVGIPALIRLLSDLHEGPRSTSSIALGRIGPAASEALPALREALNDPSEDVREFARRAIALIEQR